MQHSLRLGWASTMVPHQRLGLGLLSSMPVSVSEGIHFDFLMPPIILMPGRLAKSESNPSHPARLNGPTSHQYRPSFTLEGARTSMMAIHFCSLGPTGSCARTAVARIRRNEVREISLAFRTTSTPTAGPVQLPIHDFSQYALQSGDRLPARPGSRRYLGA